MPENTQKQIAGKYKENLTYYKTTHPLRRARFWLTMLAFVGGLVWALGFHHLGGTPEFFNTGPISQNHERFKNDCSACHKGATTDMLAMLPLDQAHAALRSEKTPLIQTLKDAGSKAMGAAKESIAEPEKLAAAAHAALSALNLDNIDKACLDCHAGMSLHQPGSKAVMFRDFEKELSIVGAGECSVCHKEHVGTARMRLPTAATCIDCHGDEKKLNASLKRADFAGKYAAAHSQNARIGDVVQWVPAAQTGAKPAVIRSFADGHPEFLYARAGAKDTAQIKFRHAYHLDPEGRVTRMNDGKVMECRECHVPDGDGVGMRRIRYEEHCQRCHQLAADPELPGFNIPHRDPGKVREFLSSLNVQWSDYAQKHFNITDDATMRAFIEQRGRKFVEKWGTSLDDMQRKVFFTGDPPIDKAPGGQSLAACVKCHTVTDAKPVPQIAPTVIPDGWLTRGPYPHGPHLHMACTDCHGAARESGKGVASLDARDTGPTQDILLPSQKVCAECHRPRDYNAGVVLTPTVKIAPTFGEFSTEAAAKQRREGGVFDSCLGCHKYHVPAAEMEIGKALVPR